MMVIQISKKNENKEVFGIYLKLNEKKAIIVSIKGTNLSQ